MAEYGIVYKNKKNKKNKTNEHRLYDDKRKKTNKRRFVFNILTMSLIITFGLLLLFSTLNIEEEIVCDECDECLESEECPYCPECPDYPDYPDYPDFVIGENYLNVSEDITSNSSGTYNGTYTFYYDSIGSVPDGWTDDSTLNCHTVVIRKVGTHKNVLKCLDYLEAASKYDTKHYINEVNGTVEFYLRTTNSLKAQYFYIEDEFGTPKVKTYINTGNFLYEDEVGIHIIATCNNNQWYHIKIDFECESNNHTGLSADTYRFTLDGVVKGVYDFRDPTDWISIIHLYSAVGTTSNYITYYDAFGFSWDGNYSVGENIYQWTEYTHNLYLYYSFDRSWENIKNATIDVVFDINITLDYNSTNCGLFAYNFDTIENDTINLFVNDTVISEERLYPEIIYLNKSSLETTNMLFICAFKNLLYDFSFSVSLDIYSYFWL